MTVQELQDALTAADAAYVEKTAGGIYIGAQLSLSQSHGWEAYLYPRASRGDMGARFRGNYCDTPEASIQSLMDAIVALPSLEEARLRDFQKDLGHLIDKGNKYGIEVDYLNPLTETMKQLSENILEYQP